MTCEHAHDDGAYVLGALAPAERGEFERHLAGCPDCSRAVQELAGLVGLLARVPPDVLDFSGPAEQVPESTLPGLMARARGVQRRRTWLTATAAAVAAAVFTAGGLAALGLLEGAADGPVAGPAAPTAPSRPMVPLGGAPVTAQVALTSVPWGTRLDLECRYSAPAGSSRESDGVTYVLFVRSVGGRLEQVATWRALPDRTMRLAAATATSRDRIADVQVRLLDGRRLLTLRG